MRKLGIALGALTAAISAPALATTAPLDAMQALSAWNVVVLGDATLQSEADGRIFVGGNATTGSNSNTNQHGQVDANGTPISGAALTVVGNLTGSYSAKAGDVLVGGNATSAPQNMNGTDQHIRIGGTGVAPSNFNNGLTFEQNLNSSVPSFLAGLQAQKDALTTGSTSFYALSSNLSTMATTSGISEANGVFTVTGGGLQVIDLTAADFQNIGTISFAGLSASNTVVVNVAGSSIALNKNVSGAYGTNVLFNFYEASSLAVDTQFLASVLAPDAAVDSYGATIDGAMVFGSLDQVDREIHLSDGGNQSFVGTLTPPAAVPEASTWAMMTLAFGFVGYGLRRKRSVNAPSLQDSSASIA